MEYGLNTTIPSQARTSGLLIVRDLYLLAFSLLGGTCFVHLCQQRFLCLMAPHNILLRFTPTETQTERVHRLWFTLQLSPYGLHDDENRQPQRVTSFLLDSMQAGQLMHR